jgi:hypothetical protein
MSTGTCAPRRYTCQSIKKTLNSPELSEVNQPFSVIPQYEIVNLGTDWHVDQCRVARMIDQAGPQPAQRFRLTDFLAWARGPAEPPCPQTGAQAGDRGRRPLRAAGYVALANRTHRAPETGLGDGGRGTRRGLSGPAFDDDSKGSLSVSMDCGERWNRIQEGGVRSFAALGDRAARF